MLNLNKIRMGRGEFVRVLDGVNSLASSARKVQYWSFIFSIFSLWGKICEMGWKNYGNRNLKFKWENISVYNNIHVKIQDLKLRYTIMSTSSHLPYKSCDRKPQAVWVPHTDETTLPVSRSQSCKFQHKWLQKNFHILSTAAGPCSITFQN